MHTCVRTYVGDICGGHSERHAGTAYHRRRASSEPGYAYEDESTSVESAHTLPTIASAVTMDDPASDGCLSSIP